MTIRTLVVFLIPATLAGCALAPQQNALHVARAYSAAVTSGDVETLVALTEPEVLQRVPADELRRAYTGSFAGRNGGDVLWIRDEVGAISEMFVDETGMHFFIVNRRTNMQRDGTDVEVENFYLLTSRDLGQSWKVLDNSCVDESWIRGVAPGWSGIPATPKQNFRATHVDAKILGATPVPTTPASEAKGAQTAS